MTTREERLMRTFAYVLLLAAIAITFTGCATWDRMGTREKSAIVGAAVTHGAVLGTIGGAAIGGVVGDQVGKRR